MLTAKLIKRIDRAVFEKIVAEREIVVSAHALDHLNIFQRNIYDENCLINVLRKERFYFVGLQKNGKYAVFFRRKDHYLKLIVVVTDLKVKIVTFLNSRKTIRRL